MVDRCKVDAMASLLGLEKQAGVSPDPSPREEIMATVLGLEKQAGIGELLGRFARSGAGLPVAGGLAGAGLATPDALEALRAGDTTGAALRWGGGAAAGTGAGFLGKGLARTSKTLGKTQARLGKTQDIAKALKQQKTGAETALAGAKGQAANYQGIADESSALLNDIRRLFGMNDTKGMGKALFGGRR